MKPFKRFLQHYFNPLHVYCRMREVGLAVPLSMAMCSVYERFLYRYLA